MSRILIVEDDTVLCRVLRNWLERKKMQVEVATTLAGARRIMAAADADIVLSDLRLPDGDGIELLEWMNEQHYRIPFIVMTQHAEVLSAVRASRCRGLSAQTLFARNALHHVERPAPPHAGQAGERQGDIPPGERPNPRGGTACRAGRLDRPVGVDPRGERHG